MMIAGLIFLCVTTGSACSIFFFFNDTATTEIYTLSLHDALPIFGVGGAGLGVERAFLGDDLGERAAGLVVAGGRSEEHTSELQSQFHLVCRLLLEKKKNKSIVEYIKAHPEPPHLNHDIVTPPQLP